MSIAQYGGALVISLDFELHWGVRDVWAEPGRYARNLLGAREVVPRLLELFVARRVAATWAVVGFLFAESRDELEAFHPVRRVRYANARLNPYAQTVGADESQDPLHYAPTLIRLIGSAPRQEVASHTYSHYYCLEKGADVASFGADLDSAVRIASARGFQLRSLVLPRNQWEPGFAGVVQAHGFECFRGNQDGWMYRAAPHRSGAWLTRAARLLDAHVPVTRWGGSDVGSGEGGICNVPASCFLRPRSGTAWRDRAHLARITAGMTEAARAGRVFHIWWHPHNFGRDASGNLDALNELLSHYSILRDQYGMESLCMIDVARRLAPAAVRE